MAGPEAGTETGIPATIAAMTDPDFHDYNYWVPEDSMRWPVKLLGGPLCGAIVDWLDPEQDVNRKECVLSYIAGDLASIRHGPFGYGCDPGPNVYLAIYGTVGHNAEFLFGGPHEWVIPKD